MENDLLKQIAALSPEEREALKGILSSPKKEEESKPKLAPETARAKPVYWFKSIKTGRISMQPLRIASKMFYEMSRFFEYLGYSTGQAWKQGRDSGKSVRDAQDDEYKSIVGKTPPADLRNTNLGKGSSFSLERRMSNILNESKDLEFKKEIYGKTSQENLVPDNE